MPIFKFILPWHFNKNIRCRCRRFLRPYEILHCIALQLNHKIHCFLETCMFVLHSISNTFVSSLFVHVLRILLKIIFTLNVRKCDFSKSIAEESSTRTVTWASFRTVWGTTRNMRPGPTSLRLNFAFDPWKRTA